LKELKRMKGIFAGLLDEQNRYSAERVGEQSILRSAFVPLPVGDDPWQARPVHTPQADRFIASPPQSRPVTPVPQHAPMPVDAVKAYAPARASNGNGNNGNKQMPRARIRIELDGKAIGERVLDQPTLTIGRLDDKDVQIPSKRISRLHAKIHLENGAWVIEDADSLNGITYQGQRVDR
ncbi:MAG TPA: hypothetical protein DHW02_09625, partial [Ktedonobacter sp.]|nr:hypothetical protein [Ktedonobacter sp.]